VTRGNEIRQVAITESDLIIILTLDSNLLFLNRCLISFDPAKSITGEVFLYKPKDAQTLLGFYPLAESSGFTVSPPTDKK
jgi:hypothetical protein